MVQILSSTFTGSKVDHLNMVRKFITIFEHRRYLNTLKSVLLRDSIVPEQKNGRLVIDDLRRPNNRVTANSQIQNDQSSAFPTIKMLGMSTENRKHSFDVSCDKMLFLIKMGITSPNFVVQYCHYICHLAMSSCNEDKHYYAERSMNILNYLLRNKYDLVDQCFSSLIANVSETSIENCTKICQKLIDDHQLRTKLTPSDKTRILSACYKYGTWDSANSFFEKVYDPVSLSNISFDSLISGMAASTSSLDQQEDTHKLKKDIINHFSRINECAFVDRVPFFTNFTDTLVDSLRNLGLQVTTHPEISAAGQCLNCKTELPTYDSSLHIRIHDIVKKKLLSRTLQDITIQSSELDIRRFETFIEKLSKERDVPIGCVIDGCNVGYKCSEGIYYVEKQISDDLKKVSKRHSPQVQAKMIIRCIMENKLIQRFGKILVIGRQHMTRWPGLIESLESLGVEYYFSSNSANDDLFILYAATKHPQTQIVSGDLFRDCLRDLSPEQKTDMERWTDTHQCWSYEGCRVKFATPYQKIPSLSKKNNVIHIPAIQNEQVLDSTSLPPRFDSKLMTWICCKI